VNQAVSQLQDAFSNALVNIEKKGHPDPAAESRCKSEGKAF